MNRVPAFTLLEVLVSLLLLAIVGGLVFVVLQTLAEGTGTAGTAAVAARDRLWLEQALRADLERVDRLSLGPEGSIELANDTVRWTYRFTPDSALRQADGAPAGGWAVPGITVAHVPVRPGMALLAELTLEMEGPPQKRLVLVKHYDRATPARETLAHGHTDPY